MLWFTVWSAIVLGTLIGAFFLGRRLWRSGRALFTEVSRAGEAAARLEALEAELAERFPAPVPPRPAIDAGAAERDVWRTVRRTHRDAVRHRRSRRLDRALRHWSSLTTPPADRAGS